MKKRSVTINNHLTSVSLEEPFWDALKTLAAEQNLSLNALITRLDDARPKDQNLSSALRVYVLAEVQNK